MFMTTLTAENQTPIEQIIARELSVTPSQIWAAIKLLDSGSSVPFIARYRKEATGGLTDTHLRLLADRLEYLRDLEHQRISILQSIEDQGKLTASLKELIAQATTKAQLEDLYLPFKPKRQSKAQMARDRGLEPLATLLWENPDTPPEEAAKNFVNADKAVPNILEALNGARDILVEKFAENAPLLGKLRAEFMGKGWIISEVVKGQENPDSKFTDYFNFREAVNKIPSHRILALFRGRQEGVLRVSLEPSPFDDAKVVERNFVQMILSQFGIETKRRAADAWILETAKFAWKYKIKLHLELDLMTTLKKNADEEAIRVFAENLRNLLLTSPAGPRTTMGLDPGFRTGVKVAIVGASGKVLQKGAIYPHAPENEWAKSLEILAKAAETHGVELIAIGNGTASRETDKLVSELLKNRPDLKLQKIVVSEAGASVYSASALASEELPGMDVSIRGAVSIARRLQDPLAELVKIDPKSIGVGQYQHDVNQRRLEQMLHNVIEDCVNAVGVDINTASASLLSYISGLSKKTAASIVEYRETKGGIKSRAELSGVPDMGPKTFEQAAGFLRIRGGENPLDASGVHPEAYPLVETILKNCGKDLKSVIGNVSFLRSIKPENYVNDSFGLPTVCDILNELEKPGRDPRPEFKTAVFKDEIQAIDDLKPGMVLEGMITNVANFGAFVDIGVHQDGLVHVSQLAEGFIRDPHSIVKTGQIVKVRVLEIDKPRKRISLTLRLNATNSKATR